MERVRKTFFNPLATTKAEIRKILEGLPAGSAHPYSPERILLCRTDDGINEIDISSYPEDYFFNAVDLGEMGETLLQRMAGFQSQLKLFDDYQIQQAPASTFKVPIVSGEITILALSLRKPTYYDLCLGDASFSTSCYNSTTTFSGINHSGDVMNGQHLLQFFRVHKETLTDKELCVFISGYTCTQITKFLGTHPALLVANHIDKTLSLIPVPLDAATIGESTICCPLVIKRDGDSLICSILPTATTDESKMCSSANLKTDAFPEAIRRADFNISAPQATTPATATAETATNENNTSSGRSLLETASKENAVITTSSVTLPSLLNLDKTQIINFGTGLEFRLPDEQASKRSKQSSVVLPCIFGSQLEGPVLLATGTLSSNVPYVEGGALRKYYEQLKDVVVIVDDKMTDNARNLADSFRLNALFIVQLREDGPKDTDEVLSLLNSTNINAVTALAGPQSLVLVQISKKYYFYRGIANREYLNTSGLPFGSDVTSVVEKCGAKFMIDPRAKRIVDLGEANAIILPISGHQVNSQDLPKLFEDLRVDQIQSMEEDISAAVPQLQMLLNNTELRALSKNLVGVLSAKVNNIVAPLKNAYVQFLNQEYQATDPELVKKKNNMLGEFRKTTKETQKALELVISSLANMMSSQTTSKRTHDLKRLVRQAQIQGNVEAAKSINFESLAGYLETYAAEMGVMLVNIEETQYRQLLGNLSGTLIDASKCCEMDSRVLHLEGIDAGIILEQSQNQHQGPLQSQSGVTHPILAMPYLSQSRGTGSMLAWVCWDEFVDLESPYTVRWVDKCNEGHIAALRIIMRDTLSQAIASRDFNFQAGGTEIGYLMSSLLMASMTKLAALRTSAPAVVEKTDNTATKLMRGLFGNLLTIAGSGLRPLSMVWQLFGMNSSNDIPTTDADWIWYEFVVRLYPYTGWPLEQFYGNLQRFLDKIIVRVVTNNEIQAEVRMTRAADMVKFCKLRNIQLEHSRTIITIFMRMLTDKKADVPTIAKRLLDQLPHSLEKQSQSYTKMITYLEHLSTGEKRRPNDDVISASVYSKRSAAFAELKGKVSEAFKAKDWDAVKSASQAILDKHTETATLWHVNPESFKFQNMEVYKTLVAIDIGEEIAKSDQSKNKLTRQVLGDAEKTRVAWQVGKAGEFGPEIEPLNEAFLHEMLTGETLEPVATTKPEETPADEPMEVVQLTREEEIAQFKSTVEGDFIKTMQKDLTAHDVCRIMKVSVPAMQTFIKALNPDFVWEDLGSNFKDVVLALLKNRSGRAESHPVKTLLELGNKKTKMIIG